MSRFSRSFFSIFTPPFAGLPLVIWLYYAACFLLHPQSPILYGKLPDPDDYMYLAQVTDWLQGQDWFDNIQHRLNPPEGAPIHFSRLTQLPMAALILLLRPFLGLKAASIAMAAILPLLLLAGLFVALRWLAGSFMPKEWANATSYVTLFLLGLMHLFVPGHIDHHALILLILALALGCLAQMVLKPQETTWPVAAGCLLALGMAVALEILPWLLLIAVWLGLWSIAKGREAARAGLAFGLSLYIASFIFLLLTRPPASVLEMDMLSYSTVYVILAGSIATCFAGLAIAANRGITVRCIAGISLAGITGLLFLVNFPELVHGPYGAMDKALAALMFRHIDEAVPMAAFSPSWIITIWCLLLPLIATAVSIRRLKQAAGDNRWMWGLMLVLLVSATLLATFYQLRFFAAAQMFSIIPLTAALKNGYQRIHTRRTGIRAAFAKGFLALLLPLVAVFIPAMGAGHLFSPNTLLFPVTPEKVEARICNMPALLRVLNAPDFAERPHIIMDTMAQGPEILFHTPHKVLAAPFHGDVSGNLDAIRFFSTDDPAQAEAIARGRNVDLVVVCGYVSGMYTGEDSSRPSLVNRLVKGQPPGWLRRIDFPEPHNYLLYQTSFAGK